MSTLKTEEPKTHREEEGALIDTSKMSSGQRAALEMTEAARETASERGSFGSELFMGRLSLNRLFPFPEQSVEDRAAGDVFLKKLAPFLREHVDPDEIDRTGEIPQEVIDGLAQMRAFGIKVAPSNVGLRL